MIDLCDFDKLLSSDLHVYTTTNTTNELPRKTPINKSVDKPPKNTLPTNVHYCLQKQNIAILEYHSSFNSDEYLDDGFWLYDKTNNYIWYTNDGTEIINPDVEFAKQVAIDNKLDIDFDIDYGQPDMLVLSYKEVSEFVYQDAIRSRQVHM